MSSVQQLVAKVTTRTGYFNRVAQRSRTRGARRRARTTTFLIALLVSAPSAGEGQQRGAVITGHVRDAASGAAAPGAIVALEGTSITSIADSAGAYRIAGAPAGPQVLFVRRVGYAPARVAITVPPTGTLVRDLELAVSPLQLQDVTVTADAAGRARGELGTASVIDRDAIAVQSATSLAGILELVPGVPLAPPGLDGVQQIALRSVPTSFGGFTQAGPSAGDLASFGTLIVLDGVPVSNNANLQSLGPRGDLGFLLSTSAGGGVDLRRIPASTLDRVEVIRGIPSARYGDLTQGVIVVDTRAGTVRPAAQLRYDARTIEGSLVAGGNVGRILGGRQLLTATADVARTQLSPGIGDDDVLRVSGQLSHRAFLGRGPDGDAAADDPAALAERSRLVLDSRVDYFRLTQNNPEQPEVFPGRASWARDYGVRVSERARLRLSDRSRLELTASLDHGRQRSYAQSLLIRSALPFTDRLEPGRQVGRYIGGEYLSSLSLEGSPWLIYSRLEGTTQRDGLGGSHIVRAGAELRREWNAGEGYQFDIEFPPQTTFNGVQGFDRPYPFDVIPAVATSALYLDERYQRSIGRRASLDIQAGIRLEALHEGTSWFSGARDVVPQPRINAQIAPVPWIRLRAGAGRTAKLPTIASLFPAPQYFDVVNVNWFTNDPAERLAILTTSIRDPSNPELGFAVGDKLEAGIELAPDELFGGRLRGLVIALTAFDDRTRDAVGIRRVPDFLLREHFDFADSTIGTGQPPTIIEPASRVDSVPILIDRPDNMLDLTSSGYELTAIFPEIPALRTRLHVQGALIKTRLTSNGLDFGNGFSPFQLDERIPRSPYWENATRVGERALMTYRLIHHEPALGLVVTGTVQHFVRESSHDVGGTDSLSFAGYITRGGSLVPVPAEERTQPQYADLRDPRIGIFTQTSKINPDWFLSLQVSKALPGDGRLSFYAFNVLDRAGRGASQGFGSRPHPGIRFGVELSVAFGRAGGGA